MAQPPFTIRYDLALPGGHVQSFEVRLDPVTLQNLAQPPTTPPEWTRLSYQQCGNCPLKEEDSPHCPNALHLAELVARFADVFSYEKVNARVVVPERAYVNEEVPIQAALSGLIGIYMVTSGCPVLGRLRPMVRFHLPFAGELETITRAVSMYLLEQYVRAARGETPDWSLGGLVSVYEAAGEVNVAFAKRLRAAAPKDANVNALIRLDTYARAMPYTIESQLEELGFLFPRR
jgi:hypothetical protein